jgi:hypothetical protein
MKKSFLILLLLSCVYLDNVTQPSSVTIGERFTITINGNHLGMSMYDNRAWLAMMLPTGFLVDSIRYHTNDSVTGVVTQLDSLLCQYVESLYPCDSHMCWQGFATDIMGGLDSASYTAIIYVLVTDSTVPGTYLIDYLSGNDEYIVDDSIFDQPMLVNETAVGEIVEHRTSKRNTVWPTIFRNTLNITTDNADVIEIFSKDGRLVKSFYLGSCIMNHGSAISWRGDDNAGRKLPSGVYFVKFSSGDYEETEKVLLVR